MIFRRLYAKLTDVTPLPSQFLITVLVLVGALTIGVCHAESNQPEVRVGTELDFPPYAFLDVKGEPTGFSIELIKAVSSAMGLSIKVSTGSWDAVWNDLVTGKIDALPIVAKAPERERLVDFSLPHTETYDAFFMREGDPPLKNISETRGMEIVVMRSGAAHHELLAHNFRGNLVLVDTIATGLSLISSGKHKALLCSKLIGTLLIKKQGLKGLSAGPPIPDYKRVFSFAVKKDDRQLLEKLNQGLLIVKTNGEYDRIYDKWLTANDPWRKARKYFWPAVIVAVALALIAVIWVATLQQIIRKRNRELVRRKRAEEALHQSEKRLQATLDATPFPVAVVNLDYDKISYWSQSALTLFGHTAPTAPEWYQIAYPDPDYRREVINRWKSYLEIARESEETVNTGEYRVTCKDGSERICELYATFLPDNLIVTFNDITERNQADKALQESEELLRRSEVFLNKLLDAIPIPVFYKDRDGKYIGFNNAFEHFFGNTKEQLVGKSVFDINPPELAEIYHLKDEELMKSGEAQLYESQVKNAQGKLHDVIFNKAVFTDNKGTVKGLIGAILDITERKKMEAKLRKSERLHKEAQRVAKIGHWELDSPSGTPAWSEEIFHIFGLDPKKSEPSFAAHANIIHDEDWDLLDNSIQELSTNGTPFDLEFRIKRSNGEIHWMHARGSADKNEGGSVTRMFGTAQDITVIKKAEEERNDLQRKLQQTQKMESIGNLAGGIAHDFNNILSSVIGFTELALDDATKGTLLEDSLQEVYTAGKRGRDLVKQILAFARQTNEERKPLRVDTITKEVLKLIRSTIPTTIEIKASIESNSLIMGNSSQIHQMLMNLCTNAAQAMAAAGGILEVGLKDVELDGQSALPPLKLKAGNYIKITVADTGHGIPPDILGSIFEPYFTTKSVGDGTGMGLALAHGIVESYGGEITVESELGKVTIFSIFLPTTKRREDYRPYEDEKLPTGTERILFVDDEFSIAKMGSQVLERLGYQVTVRTSSVEALELFRSKPNEFDLVITDMTMPNMTGDELAMELIAFRPDIPVILCTGYSKNISDEKAAKIGIRAFAYKPVVKADLAKTVRKVLDDAKSGAHA